MPRVGAIYVSPVKSLRLRPVGRARIGPHGVAEDRRFVLVDARGRLVTQRAIGALARAESEWDPDTDALTLRLPDGEITGSAAGGEPVTVPLFGRDVPGRALDGPLAGALSDLAGRPLRLVRVDGGIRGADAHAVSILSRASADELARQAGVPSVDARRFRPNVLVEGVEAHAEDGWVGGRVAIGEAVVRVVERDVRCALTQRNPDTGARDADTLRWIARYRPPADGGGVCFGVYAEVETPGDVAAGDPVRVLPAA